MEAALPTPATGGMHATKWAPIADLELITADRSDKAPAAEHRVDPSAEPICAIVAVVAVVAFAVGSQHA